MRLITRTIFREIFVTAMLGAALFTFVLFLQQAGKLFEFLVRTSGPPKTVAYLFALVLPVMLPFALLVGYKADTWGRKPLFLTGFAILPIRAVLYTLSDNSFWLIGVQLLDGVGAGIFGALAPLVIADIMRGTGRYNLAQGAIATMQGIGASLSGLAAGEIVDHFGYTATFLTLGAAALLAVIVFFLLMPETAQPETAEPQTVSPRS